MASVELISGGGGALQYQMDTGVSSHFQRLEHSMRTQSQKMRGHWVRSQILVQNYGALGENVTFDLSVSALKVGI